VSSTSARLPRSRPLGRDRGGLLFLGPAAVILILFVAWPIVRTAWISLHDWPLTGRNTEFVGLANYEALLADGRFWNAVRVTFIYTFAAVVLQTGLGLALAIRLRTTSLVSSLTRSAYFFPTIAALVTMGLVWRFLLDPQIGLIDGWVSAAGLVPPDWLRDTTWALPSVIGVGVWKNTGFSMIILVAAIQDVPRALEEAAAIDGANSWQRLRYVVVPSIRPALLFVAVINTIASLQLFDLVFAMTGGGPLFSTETLVTYLVDRGFGEFDFGYAAAISWMLFIVIMFVSVIQLRVFRHDAVD
jgi:ABC-type sugar transport system permease subunit